MKYVLAALFLASFPATAVFQEIWGGYKTSTVEQLRDLETDAVKNALDVSLSENAWSFQLNGNFEDTNLDALFSFNAQRTISDSFGLKLSKPTFRYGTISFEHRQTRFDISHWTQNLFSTTNVDLLYEARNSITYSYDILGKSMPLREEKAVAQYDFDSSQNSLDREQEYLDFYRAYLAAKLQVYRTRLAVEFRERATRLRKVLYRRYKDGLSREAEYLQAKNAELAQKQEVEVAQSALKQSVAVIENILGKAIPKQYFDALKWEFFPFDYWSGLIPKRENKSMEALEARIRLTLVELARFENDRSQRLTLNAAYTTNAFSEDIDDSLYQGDFIQPANDAKQVSLVYTLPLGTDYHKSEREKLFLDKKRAQLRRLKLQDELRLRAQVFAVQIANYEKAHTHANEQVAVADKRVKLQAQLYLRGLGTFDETIRAEEELLRAKSSLYQTLYDYDSILGSYAFLHGAVEPMLNAYKD